MADVLAFFDEDGYEVVMDEANAAAVWALTAGLDAATVSACSGCRSRVLAVVALRELLDEAVLHPAVASIIELTDDAPTLHLYVEDLAATCRHRRWRDPGHTEWAALVAAFGPGLRGVH